MTSPTCSVCQQPSDEDANSIVAKLRHGVPLSEVAGRDVADTDEADRLMGFAADVIVSLRCQLRAVLVSPPIQLGQEGDEVQRSGPAATPKAGAGEPANHIPEVGEMVNHEARRDGVRVTNTLVQRFMDRMFGEYTDPGNTQTWVSPSWMETKDRVRSALEAALPVLGDGRAEIVEECARVADEAAADAYRKEAEETIRGHHVRGVYVGAYLSQVHAIKAEAYTTVAAAIRSLSSPGGGR